MLRNTLAGSKTVVSTSRDDPVYTCHAYIYIYIYIQYIYVYIYIYSICMYIYIYVNDITSIFNSQQIENSERHERAKYS